MRERAAILRHMQRAQRLYVMALVYRGPEREYLGVAQGLADAYCELQILRELL